MKKSNIINALTERIGKLEEQAKVDSKKGKRVKEDEEVCPECGGDLLWVEEGIVYCSKCNVYYENGEEVDE